MSSRKTHIATMLIHSMKHKGAVPESEPVMNLSYGTQHKKNMEEKDCDLQNQKEVCGKFFQSLDM